MNKEWFEIEGFRKYLYNPIAKRLKVKLTDKFIASGLRYNKKGSWLIRDGIVKKNAFVYFDKLVLNDDNIYEVS